MMKVKHPLRRCIRTALFAALIAVSCVISIQITASPVPIVLQNMFAVLAGTMLGGLEGSIAVLIFLAAGALGMPVFSGGTGGFARVLGPTGGYLIGYFFGALLSGIIAGRPKIEEKWTRPHFLRILLAGFSGFAVIYLLGTPYLAHYLAKSKGITFTEAFPLAMAAGVYPFLPGCLVKLIILVPLTIQQRPVLARYY